MIWVLLAAVSMILPPVPGAIDPSITQDNIQTTICKNHYTGTVRPNVSVTNKLKKSQMKQFKLPGSTSKYEEDHLISLEIGGSPSDPKNLWPQAYAGQWGAHKKDRLENKLHVLVCSNKITLKEAQTAISTNWIDAYKKYVGEQ